MVMDIKQIRENSLYYERCQKKENIQDYQCMRKVIYLKSMYRVIMWMMALLLKRIFPDGQDSRDTKSCITKEIKKIPVGSAQIFPIYKAAASYKKYYESCPWFDNALFIEDVIYEGVPLSKSKVYNGKEVIDNEHYFGLDACEVGDYFTEDMVDGFMNVLPAACMRSDCSQIGEPVSDKMDKDGKYKPTYTTFKKVDKGIWEYCGDCFKGENVMPDYTRA